MNDVETVFCLIPCLLITAFLYGRFNWERMKRKESVLEGSLLLIISLELMIHISHGNDFPHSILKTSAFTYIQRIYLIFMLCVILLVVIMNLFNTQCHMLLKIQDLQHQISTKDLYQAAMVHELRNPLGSVIGGVELLGNSKQLTLEDKKNLQIVQHSASILMSLIGNILDVAKLEANKVELDQQYILFRPAIKSIVDLVEFKAQEKKINLILEVSNEVPDYVFLDQSRFNQIILNLISNAVKFTCKGFVKILVSYSSPSQHHNFMSSYVKRNSAPGGLLNGNGELNDLIQGVTEEESIYSNRYSQQIEPQGHFSCSVISDSQQLTQTYKNHSSYVDNSGKACLTRQNMSNSNQWSSFINQSSSTPQQQVIRNTTNNQISQESNNLYLIPESVNVPLQHNSNEIRHSKLSYNFLEFENQTAKFSDINVDPSSQYNMMMLNPSLNMEEQKEEEDNVVQQIQTTEIVEEDFDENFDINQIELFNHQTSILNGGNQVSFALNSSFDQAYQQDKRPYNKCNIITNSEKNVSFTQNHQLYGNIDAQRSDHSLLMNCQVSKDKSPSELSFFNLRVKQNLQTLNDMGQPNNNYNPFINTEKNVSNNRNSIRDFNVEQTDNSPCLSPFNQQDDNIMGNSRLLEIFEQTRFSIAQNTNHHINMESLGFQLLQTQENDTPGLRRVTGQFGVPPQISTPIIQQQYQNTNKRNKSENRLDQFRKQNNLPQIKTKISDFKSYIDSNGEQFKTQTDILRNLSPQLELRTVPANAPQIVQDPKIISENQQHGVLKIIIQDSGIGIKEEDQKKLFQPFCQANKQIQAKFGGTGLGLWISNKLIQLMKGSQTLRSTPNIGTTFNIEIPTDGVSYENNSPGLNSTNLHLDESLSKLSILVLVQDEFNKEILKKFLQKLNCPITFAKHYDDFLTKMQLVHIFNVFVVDADLFTLSQQSKIKKIMKHKKAMEQKAQKNFTMLILTTLDMDTRKRNKYLNDRVIIFKKPVKQNTLRNCLYQIQKKEKNQNQEYHKKSPRSKIRNHISEDLSNRRSLQNLGSGLRLSPLKNSETINEIEEDKKISQYMGKQKQDASPYNRNHKQMKTHGVKNSSNLNQMLDWNYCNVQTPVFTDHKRNRILDTKKIEQCQQVKKNLCSQIMDHESHQVLNSNENAQNDVQDQYEEEIKEHNQNFQDSKLGSFHKINSGLNSMFKNSSSINQNSRGMQTLNSLLQNDGGQLFLNKSNTFMSKFILIVDDQYYNRYVLENMLLQLPEIQQQHLQFLHASDGLEAFEQYKLKHQQISLILTDLNMPRMDGKEMSLNIREFETLNGFTNCVYIVGITGEDIKTQEFKRQYSKAKSVIDIFIEKVGNFKLLASIIRQIFEQH